jgi:hypothetical protein
MSGLRRLPLFLAATVASAAVAYPSMFSNFSAADDEGYVLISLKGFLAGGHLYDQVYTQYGPFFFQFWGGLFSLLGLDVNHDVGRLATIAAWVAVALIVGFAVYRVTGSVLLGLCVQLLVFHGLFKFINEPMHPGGLICLVLAAIVLASTAVDRLPRAAWGVIGAAAAALVLTKVNVGGFAVLAIALACVLAYPQLRRPAWLRPVLEGACVALPIALMARQLDLAWVREYALHATVAIAAVVIGLRVAGPLNARIGSGLRWLVGGFVVLAAASLLVALLLGSGPVDLAHGVVLDPLRTPDVIAIELELEAHSVVVNLLALALCAGFAIAARRPGRPSRRLEVARALAGVAAGLAIGLTAADVHVPLVGGGFEGGGMWALSLAWVALLPTRVEPRPGMGVARRLLPALAVLESLHAYPVAGSQVQWSAFLMIAVGAIAFDNGRRDLVELAGEGSWRATRGVAAAVPAVALALIAVAAIVVPLGDARDRYDAGRALALDGAERLHLPDTQADQLEQVVAELRADCDSFLSQPGMNSFYLWTGIDPPTYLNTGDWMLLFDEPTQRAVVSGATTYERLCLLRQQILAALWVQGRPIPERSLTRFLASGFEPLGTVGWYEILIRADG